MFFCCATVAAALCRSLKQPSAQKHRSISNVILLRPFRKRKRRTAEMLVMMRDEVCLVGEILPASGGQNGKSWRSKSRQKTVSSSRFVFHKPYRERFAASRYARSSLLEVAVDGFSIRSFLATRSDGGWLLDTLVPRYSK
jgi:hypothetical protein